MKKVFALMAAVAAFGMVACTPDSKPGEDNGPAAEAPVADFEYSVDQLTVTFTNKSQNAVSYKWAFGDEETSKEQNPKHEYAAAGEYTVVLTAANADGATSKKEAKITLAGAVKAYFSAAVAEGRKGEWGKGIQFDATSSSNAASIAWEFGDGETSSEFTPIHVFPAFGKYTVKATVTGLAGDVDTYSAEVECVKNVEAIKGGSMEADDAAYWTIECNDAADSDPLCKSWTHTFGQTEFVPSAGAGAAVLIENTQAHDQSGLFLMYQAFEVKAGDTFQIEADLKWSNFINSGLVRVGVTMDITARDANNYVPDACAVVDMVNYWAGYGNTRVADYDGNLSGDADFLAFSQANGNDFSNPGEVVTYTASESGTAYFYIDVRNIWGDWGTPESRMLLAIDNVKVTALVD